MSELTLKNQRWQKSKLTTLCCRFYRENGVCNAIKQRCQKILLIFLKESEGNVEKTQAASKINNTFLQATARKKIPKTPAEN